MIGLLCTTDGIPIAHHVFAGNTNDASTLSEVLNGLAKRFAVGRICVVADRGLISGANPETVSRAGYDHLLATKLRRDRITAGALSAIGQDTVWVDLSQLGSRATNITLWDGTRTVVVESDPALGGTHNALPRSSKQPKPGCWRWITASARVGSKTPPRSAEPPNESSAPGVSGDCSIWRSARGVFSTTTTKTTMPMRSCWPVVTC